MSITDKLLESFGSVAKKVILDLEEPNQEIRKIEAYLTESGIRSTYYLDVLDNGELTYSIGWDRVQAKKNKIRYRLLLTKKDKGKTISKPFIEWPLVDREHLYIFLPAFLEAFTHFLDLSVTKNKITNNKD